LVYQVQNRIFFIGDIPYIIKHGVHNLLQKGAEYGDIVLLHFGPEPHVIVYDMQLGQSILQGSRRSYVVGFNDCFPDSVFSANGDQWKRYRSISTPVFHKNSLQILYPVMLSMANEWIDKLSAQTSFDSAKEFTTFGLDVLLRTIFGVDKDNIGRTEVQNLAQHTQNFLDGICKRLFNPFWKIIEGSDMTNGIKALNKFIYGQIKEVQKTEEGTDILSRITHAKVEGTGEGLSLKEIRDNALLYIVAGHETTAASLIGSFIWLQSIQKFNKE